VSGRSDGPRAARPLQRAAAPPSLDAVFDQGYVTFDESGTLMISVLLTSDDVLRLGLEPAGRLSRIEAGHEGCLAPHRRFVFRDAREHGGNA
jgi:hypothetical protein